jgi:hypothetical protein
VRALLADPHDRARIAAHIRLLVDRINVLAAPTGTAKHRRLRYEDGLVTMTYSMGCGSVLVGHGASFVTDAYGPVAQHEPEWFVQNLFFRGYRSVLQDCSH